MIYSILIMIGFIVSVVLVMKKMYRAIPLTIFWILEGIYQHTIIGNSELFLTSVLALCIAMIFIADKAERSLK